MYEIEEEILECYGDIPRGYGRVVGVVKTDDGHSLRPHGKEHPIGDRFEIRLLLDEYILGAICRFGRECVYALYYIERERGVFITRLSDSGPVFSFEGLKRANALDYQKDIFEATTV